MSFWDRYLAPGDLREQRNLTSLSATSPQNAADHEPHNAIATSSATPSLPLERIDYAHRERRKLALLYGGLSFTFLSLFITRRALRRKRIQIYPQTFTPSNAPGPEVNGGLEAAEALGLATLNVVSIAMATAGVLMSAFNIADVEDLRDKVRQGIGFDVYAGESEADKELEDWIADTLSKKDGVSNLQYGVLEKLAELSEKEKRLKAEANDGVLEKLAELKVEREALSSEVQ